MAKLGNSLRGEIWVTIALVTVTVSCAQRDSRPAEEEGGVGAVDNEQVVQTSTADSLTALLGRLRAIEGQFVVAENATWGFSGDREVLVSFYDYGEPAVRALVECLDDTEPSRVMLGVTAVPIGVLCSVALQGMAHATEHEDGDGDWPGVVLPTATPGDLRAAKEAWEVVLESGRFRIA